MSSKGKLGAGNEEGNGATNTAIEEQIRLRREPGSPGYIGEPSSFGVLIAHSILDARNGFWLLPGVSINDGTHIFIRSPGSRSSLEMLPGMLTIEQDGCSLLIAIIGFFL